MAVALNEPAAIQPMHELALAMSMLEVIEEAAERDRFVHVRVVHLDVGALACVDPHALSFAFEAASNGTRAQGAQLSIRHLPAVGHCDHCSHEGSIDQLYTLCPACGRETLKVISGDELRLRDLDVE